MDCVTNHIPLAEQLKAMARKSAALIGLPIVSVGAVTHTEQALTCKNNHLTFDDLLKLCIGVDSCGKPAIRVKFIDTCDTLISCSNNINSDPLKQIFAYDSTLKTFALVINQST